ncbi:hypothetical protein [Paraburkholderia sp. J11-2]|nr:hypothetical protein [Paraburkholderia sp. J11-2]
MTQVSFEPGEETLPRGHDREVTGVYCTGGIVGQLRLFDTLKQRFNN